MKAPYGMHTKGNIAKIVKVDHLVQGVKLLNLFIYLGFYVAFNTV